MLKRLVGCTGHCLGGFPERCLESRVSPGELIVRQSFYSPASATQERALGHAWVAVDRDLGRSRGALVDGPSAAMPPLLAGPSAAQHASAMLGTLLSDWRVHGFRHHRSCVVRCSQALNVGFHTQGWFCRLG
jgi:hypothetical protein